MDWEWLRKWYLPEASRGAVPFLYQIQGRVTSFYGNELRRYTSLKAHKTGAVHQLLVNEKGVIALGSNYIHMANRTGPPIWHLEYGALPVLTVSPFPNRRRPNEAEQVPRVS